MRNTGPTESMLVTVSTEDLRRLVDALDSHIYWQLGEPVYRNSGYLNEPGSDDPETAAEIAAVNELHKRLETVLHGQTETST